MKIKNVQPVKNLSKETKLILESDSSKSNKIKLLFGIGYSVKEIASMLNIRYNFAYNVVSNNCNINNIDVVKTKTTNKSDLIIDLYLQQVSSKQIAKQLQTNINYVYQTINKYKDSQLTANN